MLSAGDGPLVLDVFGVGAMNPDWWEERMHAMHRAFEADDAEQVERVRDQMMVEFGCGAYDAATLASAVDRLQTLRSLAASAGLKRARDYYQREVLPALPGAAGEAGRRGVPDQKKITFPPPDPPIRGFTTELKIDPKL